MKDSTRDEWIKENLPEDQTFDRSAVKILMRLAYDEGRERERTLVKYSNSPPEGPYDIY